MTRNNTAWRVGKPAPARGRRRISRRNLILGFLRRRHIEEREWMKMDRQAMDYREAAATSPLGSSSNNAETAPRSDYRARPGAERPILQHRRADGQVTASTSQAPVSHANQSAARNVQTVNLQSILKGAREAIIDFDGAAYRLRITRNHRLILTK